MKTTSLRTELSTWKFCIDQTGYGIGAGWASHHFDDSAWTEVQSYTSWETYEYALRDYEGGGWFRAKYTPTNTAGYRYVLHFDGVGGTAQVYVNGKYAGGTDDRYLPFDVDITSVISKNRENTIAVLVDNSFRGKEHIPGGGRVEWVLYGGLTHRVWLEERPLCHISHVRVDADAEGNLKVTAEVTNLSTAKEFDGEIRLEVEGQPQCTCTQEVFCANTKTVNVVSVTSAVLETKVENAKLWSPETPNLYNLKVTMLKDGKVHHAAEERFGFRTISVDGTKIFLNGEELLVKGANRYDEFAPYGNCAPVEKIREDLQKMKDNGMNLVRTHYPQDPIHYEIADEIGLMYMIEVPVNWFCPKREMNVTFDDRISVYHDAVKNLDNTFYWHCNHPCWAFWSVGNECFHDEPAVKETLHRLAARMREKETNRLVLYALLGRRPITNRDELEFCDVLGLNLYTGILSENLSDFPEKVEEGLSEKFDQIISFYPDKPFIMTEFGYVCVAGVHGSKEEGRYAEDFGEAFLQAKCKKFLSYPQVRGLVIWCWADYRHRRGFVTSKSNMGFQATYGPWGLVTMDRKEKNGLLKTMKEIYENWKVED